MNMMSIKEIRSYVSNIVSPQDDLPLNECIDMTLTALRIMSRATRLEKKFSQSYTSTRQYSQVPENLKRRFAELDQYFVGVDPFQLIE